MTGKELPELDGEQVSRWKETPNSHSRTDSFALQVRADIGRRVGSHLWRICCVRTDSFASSKKRIIVGANMTSMVMAASTDAPRW